MNRLQAQTLLHTISIKYPQLMPSVKTLDGGESIVVLQQLQARKMVAFMHFWQPGDWFSYERSELLKKELVAT